MKLVTAIALTEPALHPPEGLKQYLVTETGLMVRAESEHLAVCVPVAYAISKCVGLLTHPVYCHLKPGFISGDYLFAVFADAVKALPDEVMYQFAWSGAGWQCQRPAQTRSVTHVDFSDNAHGVLDLHSHGHLPAFFSTTDDQDEQGFRLYAVIGKLSTSQPEIAVRVGVYGHHFRLPASSVFTHLGPFVDTYATVDD